MAEKAAFTIGLHPAEFEDMQPGEFYQCFEAAQEAQKARDCRTAYWVSVLLSPYSKEPVKVKDLIEPLWTTPQQRVRKMMEDRKILIDEFGLNEKQEKGR